MINLLDDSKLDGLPEKMPPLPSGWINPYDLMVLYAAAKKTTGHVLEIGSWIGRSSCMIAYGLRDSENASTSARYDIVDFGITGLDEWQKRFGDNPALKKDADKILKVIYHPGGTGALLKQNLVDRELSDHVRSIFLGDFCDFVSRNSYEFVFCDTTHSDEEIRVNIPLISQVLDKENFILVCDDVVDESKGNLIGELVGADKIWMTSASNKYSKFLVCAKGIYSDSF